MFQCPGVRDNASCGNRAVAQRPKKFLSPVGAFFRCVFNIGQSAGDALKGIVDSGIQDLTVFCLKPVFLIPDISGSQLEGN
mgnify:CR=1 FL=1